MIGLISSKNLNSFAQSASRLLLLSVFAFGAYSCQPRDVELGGGAVSKFARDGKGGSKSDANLMSNKELNNLVVVSVERTSEALHLLKASLNPQYAKKNSLLKSPAEIEPTSNELPDVLLETVLAKPVKDKKDDPSSPTTPAVADLKPGFIKKDFSELQLSYKIVDLSYDLSGRLSRLTLMKNNFGKSYAKGFNASKDDFNATAMMDHITIRRGTEENTFIGKIDRDDDANSKVDRKSTISSQINFKFSWDGQVSSLDQALAITFLEMKIKRVSEGGGKQGELSFKTADGYINTLLQDCVSLNGELNVKLNTQPMHMVFTDSSVQVDSGSYTSAARACAARPVVDLGRMLNQ